MPKFSILYKIDENFNFKKYGRNFKFEQKIKKKCAKKF